MKLMEKAFHNLLQDNIIYDGSIVDCILGYAPIDETPCITINTADETFIRRRYAEIDHIQQIQKRYRDNVWINIWCNTNKERIKITEQVQNRILQAEANHYTTCSNYNHETTYCNVLKRECEALTSNKPRAKKNQCPNLNIYESFFKQNNIIKNTFCIDSITDLDELDISDVVLRTIIKLRMDYYTYYPIGGKLYENIEFTGDLI